LCIHDFFEFYNNTDTLAAINVKEVESFEELRVLDFSDVKQKLFKSHFIYTLSL